MFNIKSLYINSFRCYEAQNFLFSPGINILYGENGVGKTSIIEAIGYLGICNSFRSSKESEVLKKEDKYFFVKGNFCSSEQENIEIIVSYDGTKKKISKNGSVYKKISDYIGYFNVVIFDPSDLYIVKGTPSIRRRFLNLNISQIDKEYLHSFSKYNAILNKRNDYLKKNSNIDKIYLDAITQMLVDEAKIIIKKRQDFINFFNDYVYDIAKELSNNSDYIKVEYSPFVNIDEIDKKIKESVEKDIIYKTTTVGPHKDDIKIYINDSDAAIYGSQGQIRTIAIAFKLALYRYFTQFNDKQIILLDDVLSELDENRQNQLLKILSNETQIFITTTNIEGIDKNIIQSSKLMRIEKGGLK